MQLQDLSNSQHACQWGKSSAISSSKSNRTLNARAFTQFTEGGAPKADPCITADLSPLWINDNKFWQKYKTCLCWSRRDCGHAQFPVSPDCCFFFFIGVWRTLCPEWNSYLVILDENITGQTSSQECTMFNKIKFSRIHGKLLK